MPENTSEKAETVDALGGRATAFIDCIYFVRWEPEVKSEVDILALIRRLQAAREELGRPLHYCAVNPLYVPAPTSAVRKIIVQYTPLMLKHASCIEVVADGKGVMPSLFRTVTRAMVFSGGLQGKVFIHDTMGSVLERIRDDIRMKPAEILAEAKRAGVIE